MQGPKQKLGQNVGTKSVFMQKKKKTRKEKKKKENDYIKWR